MITVKLDQLKLLEGWFENDPQTRQKASFPFFKGTGAESLSVVYFEVEPGNTLGTHTDSAEEVILILQGKAEATVGDESGLLSAGEMALIPCMIPHNLRNIGSETLRVVGFFSSPNVVSTFAEPLMPINQRAVGTPLFEKEQPMAWNEIVRKLMG
ncbi:cupin domain-containing protein [Brevibacillus sp. H7]|uniref:cupin domain-containing protein n=1 Tax=Brevibacillus sp. H7 TaxID=3349138 RepID=UPI00381E1A38